MEDTLTLLHASFHARRRHEKLHMIKTLPFQIKKIGEGEKNPLGK
jgi:hypothetical protein